MILKSSQATRKAWGQFSIELQEFSIVDPAGNVIPTRVVFESLYDEDNGDNQVQLALIVSGMHVSYSLVKRKEYDDAILRQQLIYDTIREEVHTNAVRIARRFAIKENFDEIVKYMTEGMLYVLDNHQKIESAIRDKVK
jgi:hypothetical protein